MKNACMVVFSEKITEANFILDLGLMYDVLQELSKLSVTLQHENVGLDFAHKKVKMTVIFKKLYQDLLQACYEISTES